MPGFDYKIAGELKAGLTAAGVIPMIVSPSTGPIESGNGGSLDSQFNFENCRSTHFDAVVFVGAAPGKDEAGYAKKLKTGRIIHVAREAYMHQKAIAATGNAVQWLDQVCLPGEFTKAKESGVQQENGVLLGNDTGLGVSFVKQFIDAVAKHRVWDREVEHIAA